MRILLAFFVFCSALVGSQIVLADPPDITHNVVVMTGSTPSQCTSSMRGNAAPASDIDISRFGSNDVEGPGVQSCTGCAINQSGNCVCKTCYSYYDGD